MGVSLPWDDECPSTIELDNRVYTLTKGPIPGSNVLYGLYAEWECEYTDAAGNVHVETRRRVLWIFDF